MSRESSFHFRGPKGRLNLRAQNLLLFLQLGEGVDDATWMYHLHRGDYSRRIRDSIKDEELARDVVHVQELPNAISSKTRVLIKIAIEEYYTLPATSSILVPGHGAPTERKAEQNRP